ncbi:hypothetical protein GGQ15_002479 [Salinibacter ruber]|jgi:hypothetical protein|uniref:Uncharacterized protein n=1 Tax=Salinibacter ruber TaxID=146919 RepID=A0A9X2Q563_9BACT|nr:hypothetical protein [Salinibacter ruber]MCS3711812.1 hypothetical protein [Salinibacter ruber]MCS4142083.1 hypothetical protein [Salinibacter ruber]
MLSGAYIASGEADGSFSMLAVDVVDRLHEILVLSPPLAEKPRLMRAARACESLPVGRLLFGDRLEVIVHITHPPKVLPKPATTTKKARLGAGGRGANSETSL